MEKQEGPLKSIITSPIDPIITLVIIGLLDGFFYLLIGTWSVAGGYTNLIGNAALKVFGQSFCDKFPFWSGQGFTINILNWKVYIVLGMIFGSFLGAVLSKEFSIKYPKTPIEWILIAIGGFLMGLGVRFAFLCNISTFFSAVPQMTLAGYLGMIAILVGGFVGANIYKKILGL